MRLNRAIFRISAGISIGSGSIRILNLFLKFLPGFDWSLASIQLISGLIGFISYLMMKRKRRAKRKDKGPGPGGVIY